MFRISVSTCHYEIYERANIHIFCVGFYPDAGAGPSSSPFRPDNETLTLDDFDSLSPEEPAAQGDPDTIPGYGSPTGGAPLNIPVLSNAVAGSYLVCDISKYVATLDLIHNATCEL